MLEVIVVSLSQFHRIEFIIIDFCNISSVFIEVISVRVFTEPQAVVRIGAVALAFGVRLVDLPDIFFFRMLVRAVAYPLDVGYTVDGVILIARPSGAHSLFISGDKLIAVCIFFGSIIICDVVIRTAGEVNSRHVVFVTVIISVRTCVETPYLGRDGDSEVHKSEEFIDVEVSARDNVEKFSEVDLAFPSVDDGIYRFLIKRLLPEIIYHSGKLNVEVNLKISFTFDVVALLFHNGEDTLEVGKIFVFKEELNPFAEHEVSAVEVCSKVYLFVEDKIFDFRVNAELVNFLIRQRSFTVCRGKDNLNVSDCERDIDCLFIDVVV